MKAMPENWQPPVDAWQTEFANDQDERVFAYFGVQFRPAIDVSSFVQVFRDAADQSITPATLTRARHTDAAGFENICFIAYWHNQADFDCWWKDAGFGAWWESSARADESFGLWREVFAVAPPRFETLFSTRNPTGVARLGEPFGEPILEHNYWGGMRDRVRAASVDGDSLDSTIGSTLKPGEPQPSRCARIKVTVPDNLCLIRSGQDLRACSPDESDDYFDLVHSNLVAGMSYLRDNPEESGCISCRYMDETDLDGAHADQSFGLALFASMAHLENWAHNHPTHLAIFGSFFRLVEKREGNLQLRLWHEVLVCTGDKAICEYVSCHPLTGLLPFFAG